MADRENGSGVEGHAESQVPGAHRPVSPMAPSNVRALCSGENAPVGIEPGLPFSLSTIGPDRSLYYFHQNAKQFVEDIVMVGFDDLPELARKLQGLRSEIDQLEFRACAIAGEQMDRRARLEIATSVPPVEVG